MGYKIDWEKKKIFLTGAFYFKTSQSDALVFLNGKLVGKTDPLRKSITIKNLLPKTYKIEIKKDGFFPWIKELEIKEGLILAKTQIILFKREIHFHFLPEFNFEEGKTEKKECNVEISEKLNFPKECIYFELGKNFYFLADGKFYRLNKEENSVEKVVENVKSFAIFPNQEQLLFFNNSEIWIALPDKIKFLTRTSESIENAIFLNSGYFIFSTKNKIFIGEIDTEGGENIYQISEFGAKKMLIVKKNQLLIENEQGVFISDPLF